MAFGHVAIVGSILNGQLSDIKIGDSVEIFTSRGMSVSTVRESVVRVQLLQGGPNPGESLYRIFIEKDAELTVKLSGTEFSAIEDLIDQSEAVNAESGAPKNIEDTAVVLRWPR